MWGEGKTSVHNIHPHEYEESGVGGPGGDRKKMGRDRREAIVSYGAIRAQCNSIVLLAGEAR